MTGSSLVNSPRWFLIVGAVFLIKGTISTFAGQAWARFGSVVYRDKTPKEFWWMIVTDYAIAIGLIGLFLFLVR
jgi:hypothetical protein